MQAVIEPLDELITELAAFGVTPRDIEQTLNLPAYHIHENHHAALMKGYALRAELGDSASRLPSSTLKELRDEKKLKARAYYLKTRKRQLDYQHEYHKKHKEEINKRSRDYYERNKERIREQKRERRRLLKQEQEFPKEQEK